MPKNETMVCQNYSFERKELTYIVTQIKNELKFNLYQVNSDATIKKVNTGNNPIFKELQ
jgi:hypothetical protein